MSISPIHWISDAWADSRKRFYIIYAGLLILVMLCIYPLTQSMHPYDVPLYYEYSTKIINGLMPYLDFMVEYPPFSLVFIVIPGIFSFSLDTYYISFQIFVIISMIIGMWCFEKICAYFGKDEKDARNVFLVLSLLMLIMALFKYDAFPTVMVMLSVYCYMTKRYTLAWILLALATMTKLYPALIGIAYFIPFIIRKEHKNIFKGLAASVIVCFAVVVPFLLIGAPVFDFLTYHMDRPLQIESVASSLILIAQAFGITQIGYTFEFGSSNIVGAWPDTIAGLMLPMMLVALAVSSLIVVVFAYKRNKINPFTDREMMTVVGLFALLTTLLFIVLGKVFSAQYMMWIVALIAFSLILLQTKEKRIVMVLFAVAWILTYIFMTAYITAEPGGIIRPDGIHVIILLIRNAIVVAMTVFVAVQLKNILVQTSTK